MPRSDAIRAAIVGAGREAEMAASGKQKLKLLYLYRMLDEETDATHGLSMSQILQRLEGLGISAER
ncbi:MAG: hypothetical protein IJG82_05740 [Atopobiaceae bacterium]|nr:hypothetical protein [Atopobiaceae bacterium]